MDAGVCFLLNEVALKESTRTGPYRTGARWWALCAMLFSTATILTGTDSVLDAWTVCRYVAFLAAGGRSYSTVKTYLAGVRWIHVSKGMPDPTAYPLVRKCLHAAKRILRTGAKPKRAITNTLLRALRGTFDLAIKIDLTIWACILLAFACLLRGSEYAWKGGEWNPEAGLTRGDVVFYFAPEGDHRHPTGMAVNIKAAKTDPYRYGVVFRVVRTGGPLCAVDMLWAYVQLDPSLPPSAPLFSVEGAPLKYKRVHDRIRRACASIGLDPKEYGTHSLRSGACTSLRAAGVAWETVKILGRWSSDAALRYCQLHPSDIVDIATRMQNAPEATSPSFFSQLN